LAVAEVECRAWTDGGLRSEIFRADVTTSGHRSLQIRTDAIAARCARCIRCTDISNLPNLVQGEEKIEFNGQRFLDEA
jgi:hypothetical protein